MLATFLLNHHSGLWELGPAAEPGIRALGLIKAKNKMFVRVVDEVRIGIGAKVSLELIPI